MFVIIGTITADLLVFNKASFSDIGGDGFRAGNLVFTDKPLTLLMGGNGGNSAYVSAGLGVPTALCGSVGYDPLGDTLVNWLKARAVNVEGVERNPTQATSTSTVIMSTVSNQTVFHHLGSTLQVQFEKFPEHLFTDAEVLLCSSFPIIPKMRAGGFARALEHTHQAGGITALDIGPAIGNPVSLNELPPLFPHLDFLIANSHELTMLTGDKKWETAGARLIEAGAKNVVIKRGEAGASLRGERGTVDVPGFSVRANISVGAGDSFNMGFLYGVQQGWPMKRVVQFANAVAALVVSSGCGVLGSPTLNEVEIFLQQATD